MLWAAGQQRIVREARERLAELYVGVRDGYVAGNVGLGKAKWSGGDRVPSYARTEAPMRTPADRDTVVAKLAAMFPGAVRRGDS